MNPGVEALRRFRIDVALADHAAERRLDVWPRATEPVVEIEMAEGGVHVIAPEQPDHAPAEPDALRIAAGAADRATGFREFVDLPLGVLGGISSFVGGGLVATLLVAALGRGRQRRKNRNRREHRGEGETQKSGHGEAA